MSTRQRSVTPEPSTYEYGNAAAPTGADGVPDGDAVPDMDADAVLVELLEPVADRDCVDVLLPDGVPLLVEDPLLVAVAVCVAELVSDAVLEPLLVAVCELLAVRDAVEVKLIVGD